MGRDIVLALPALAIDYGRYRQYLLDLVFGRSFLVTGWERLSVDFGRTETGEYTHVGCNDEVQSILVAGAGLHGPEVARFPFDTIGLPKAGLLPLAVLNPEFFIGGHVLVTLLEGRDDGMPQFLRFPLVLLVDGPDGWRGWRCVSGVKEEFSLARLPSVIRQPAAAAGEKGKRKGGPTSKSLIHISPFQLPEISCRTSPVLSRLMNPPMAL